jgi:hypothetical protein
MRTIILVETEFKGESGSLRQLPIAPDMDEPKVGDILDLSKVFGKYQVKEVSSDDNGQQLVVIAI